MRAATATTRRYELKNLARDNFPLFVGYAGGCDHVLHCHDFTELVLIETGNGIHVTPNTRHRVSMGEALVIPKGIRHGYEGTVDLRMINIIFDMPLLKSAYGDLETIPGFKRLFSAGGGDGVVSCELSSLAPDEINHLRQMAKKIRLELQGRKPGYKSVCVALLTEIVAYLSRKEFTQSALDTKARLDKALEFMERNYGQAISVAAVAKVANCAPRHLQRLFVRLLDHSPVEHLLKLRVEHAKQLLTSSSLSISAIAEATGFNDSAYFTRQFRQILGMPPMSYRKLNARK